MVLIEGHINYDVSKFEFIGKGSHGEVYRIDSVRCIKIFKKADVCKSEAAALETAQKDRHFPKLFEYGDKYIIREYIEGIPLDKYLEENPLTPDLSLKIIDLYNALKKVGFSRRDTALFHVFITEDGLLKMIDPAKSLNLTTVYPERLLRGLRRLGYKKTFLSHVKAVKPKLYRLWMAGKK